jgi:ABC-type branched-subunit amino acid transport system ATPase component
LAGSDSTDILAAGAITAGYGGSAVLQDVQIAVRRGGITGIIGPNGSGKSTLLKVLVGYLRPAHGQVWLDGADITRLAPEDRIGHGIAYIAQSRSTFASQTVEENLRLGAYLVRDAKLRTERQAAVLRRFPALAERRQQFAGMLSGGEARMLEIGRMLMMGPTLAILDEPSIGLSPRLTESVYDEIRALRDEGITFLIVEQNVRKLLAIADYVFALESGRNRLAGTPAELSREGVLARLYLGHNVAGRGHPPRA